MRALIQRVSSASVQISGNNYSRIEGGLLVFLGIEEEDKPEDVKWLCGKIIRLRIFNDKNGTMNLSVSEVEGEILVVSQFTLHASTKKGNRPSYIKAAKPESAIPVYNNFIAELTAMSNLSVKTGEFGADMQVKLVNSGPVTLFIDTKNKE